MENLNAEKLKDRGRNVYIVVEDCDNDETKNVACFGVKGEAEAFCNLMNSYTKLRDHTFRKRFDYEEWRLGEINAPLYFEFLTIQMQ